uniref:Uncharacterized protein n=1 Tax=Trichuris muris TaxID=70415 RepID=A0A5S6QZJ0_TRIMR
MCFVSIVAKGRRAVYAPAWQPSVAPATDRQLATPSPLRSCPTVPTSSNKQRPPTTSGKKDSLRKSGRALGGLGPIPDLSWDRFVRATGGLDRALDWRIAKLSRADNHGSKSLCLPTRGERVPVARGHGCLFQSGDGKGEGERGGKINSRSLWQQQEKSSFQVKIRCSSISFARSRLRYTGERQLLCAFRQHPYAAAAAAPAAANEGKECQLNRPGGSPKTRMQKKESKRTPTTRGSTTVRRNAVWPSFPPLRHRQCGWTEMGAFLRDTPFEGDCQGRQAALFQ